MYVNVSPADYNFEETVSSLTYAIKAKQIQNESIRNIENQELLRLKTENGKLKEENDWLRKVGSRKTNPVGSSGSVGASNRSFVAEENSSIRY